MRIGVLGINHKSSGLAFREVLARACQKKLSLESDIAKNLSCVVLSTCNRTEIYFSAENLAQAHSELLGVLRSEIQESFEHKLYTYFGCDCFVHLALVTAGLDSVIIAETEIQRQVKVCYENTSHYYRLPSAIHYLFQKSLKIGKQVRSSFLISHGQPTLPGMILQVSQILFKQLEYKKILFIGNSEINRKVISFFKMKGLNRISLCTRSKESLGKEAWKARGIELVNWSELSSWKEYDLIICGTYSSNYLIEASEEPLSDTKLILDLSVPRSVDPLVARHPMITLLNIEELGQFIDNAQERDLGEIHRAQELLWQEAEKHFDLFEQKEKRALRCI